MTAPPIQWYPGHIAKAEKALIEQLKRVDLVLEVRDARIPGASCHPQMKRWVGEKARLLVINRVDQITPSACEVWRHWLQTQGETPYFTNAQQGKGIVGVTQAAQTVGKQINSRRQQRGMRPRPVRVAVIGFPNVGKSALINRLLKRRVVASARRPGVTRQLRWVRLSQHIDLLDAPGIIPPKLEDQAAALKLAICDDIGEAAYDTQRVAAEFIELLQRLKDANQRYPGFLPNHPLLKRFRLAPETMSGEEYLLTLTHQQYQGNLERAARQVLTDFRKGLLGKIALERPPGDAVGLEEAVLSDA